MPFKIGVGRRQFTFYQFSDHPLKWFQAFGLLLAWTCLGKAFAIVSPVASGFQECDGFYNAINLNGFHNSQRLVSVVGMVFLQYMAWLARLDFARHACGIGIAMELKPINTQAGDFKFQLAQL